MQRMMGRLGTLRGQGPGPTSTRLVRFFFFGVLLRERGSSPSAFARSVIEVLWGRPSGSFREWYIQGETYRKVALAFREIDQAFSIWKLSNEGLGNA